MKKVLIAHLLIIGILNYTLCCGCGGPINELQIDIDSSDAIFVGEITDVHKKHTFYFRGRNGFGLKYINFNVLKSFRGLNPAQLKITLFDSDSYSSCEGIFFGKEIGDTVLVFGNKMKDESMISSYLCGRHPNYKELSIEERNFVDTAKWIDPRSYHQDYEKFYQEFFGKEKTATHNGKDNMVNQSDVSLYISLSLNLLLLICLLFVLRKSTVK